MGEFEPDRTIEGGYVESSRYAAFTKWISSDIQEELEEANNEATVVPLKMDDHHWKKVVYLNRH